MAFGPTISVAQSKEVIDRIAKDGIKLVRVAWSDPHGVSRAKTVTAEAFLGAIDERLQHQRCDGDARRVRGPRLLVLHPRRRHGIGRDDRVAQPDHRPGPLHISGFAVGAKCRLGPVRRLLHVGTAVPFLTATCA